MGFERQQRFNFFEHQAYNRRMSRWLLVGFVLVVMLIVLMLNLVLSLVLYLYARLQVPHIDTVTLLGVPWWAVVLVSLIGVSIIVGPACRRLLELRKGGVAIMHGLGAIEVRGETGNHLYQRLRNITEEIAIASGISAPSAFVLENEQGINAFSAGYAPEDACVLVTNGALTELSRAELQAVIAHEFSHIMNGDMRLNMQMIAVVYALVSMQEKGVALIRMGRSGAFIGLPLVLLGGLGVIGARILKFAICRHRELLADAVATQFTRDPAALSGALKKVAALRDGGRMDLRTEQYGHMYFVASSPSLLSTHPPLLRRILVLDPDFGTYDPGERKEVLKQEAYQIPPLPVCPIPELLASVGHPALVQLRLAAHWLDRLPPSLRRAAHDTEHVIGLIIFILVHRAGDAFAGERELSRRFGEETMLVVDVFRQQHRDLPDELLLPLLEISLPAVRRLPARSRRQLREWINIRLLEALDGDAVAFLVSELVLRQIDDLQAASHSRPHGRARLVDKPNNAWDLLFFIVQHRRGLDGAAGVVRAAMLNLGLDCTTVTPLGDLWHIRIKAALYSLNDLTPREKLRLLKCMLELVSEDGSVVEGRVALVRLICVCLHIPLGPVAGPGH